jgi:hypothetical protein
MQRLPMITTVARSYPVDPQAIETAPTERAAGGAPPPASTAGGTRAEDGQALLRWRAIVTGALIIGLLPAIVEIWFPDRLPVKVLLGFRLLAAMSSVASLMGMRSRWKTWLTARTTGRILTMLAAVGVSIICSLVGGLESPYIPSLSVVIAAHAVINYEPWRVAVVSLTLPFASHLVAIILAGTLSPAIAEQWRDPRALQHLASSRSSTCACWSSW